jgi:hypothetical protein
VEDISRKEDSRWEIELNELSRDVSSKIKTDFVFIGAGGAAIPLLEKTDLPIGEGYGGFPVSGQFLMCSNEEVIKQHEAKVYEKHYNILNEIAKNQNDTYKKLSFLSPFLPIRFLSMDVANTSDILHWKFTKAAEKYRIETQLFLNNDIKDNSKLGERGYKMNANKFKNLPKFSFIPPTLSQILKENTQNMLFLSLWFIIPFIGLILTSKKI